MTGTPVLAPYKEQKQAFVSGFEGGSVISINVVSLTAATTYALWAILRTRTARRKGSANSADAARLDGSSHSGRDDQWMVTLQAWLDEDHQQGVTTRIAQFCLLVVPLLLVNTILARYALLLNLTIGGLSVWLLRTYHSAVLGSNPDKSARGSTKDWRDKSFGSSDEEDAQEADVNVAVATATAVRPSLHLHPPSSPASPWSSQQGDSSVGATPTQELPPRSASGMSLRDARLSPSPLSPVSPSGASFASNALLNEGAYDGYVVPSPQTSAPDHGAHDAGFEVSISSAADAAHAAAHPPNTYRPPDDEGQEQHSRSSSLGGRSGNKESGILRKLFAGAGDARSSADLARTGVARSSYESSRRGDSVDSSRGKRSLLVPRASIDSVTSSSESLTYDDVIFGRNRGKWPAPGDGPVANSDAWHKAARRKEFLTIYRAHMMLMTVICILAVDFKVFPREFAKCESWGTSLMDLGVGSFVFSLGIISAGPLIPAVNSPRHRFRPPRTLLLSHVKKALPLFALGLVRVIMVKGVDYPEHVTEYGVHWNFFFTLAVLPVLGSICRPLRRVARYSVIGLAIGSAYQLLLWLQPEMQAWILSDPPVRHGLLEQNKEGLASLAGYLAIYLLGIDLGHYLLPLDPYQAFRRRSNSRLREKIDKLSMVLASFGVLYWSAFLALRLLGVQSSRRLANLTYVIWVTAFNASFLLCYVAVYARFLQPLKQRALAAVQSVHDLDAKQWKARTAAWSPSLLEDINEHAFAIFLAANLLTGLINVSMQTMHAGSLTAMLVLTAYVGASCAVGSLLNRLGWRLPI